MSPAPPIPGRASPVGGSSSPPRSSVNGSAPSPLLSKVLHPSVDRIHNFPKSGLAEKEGISCTNSPDLFSTSPFDPSSSSAPFLTPSSPDLSVPRPMPFFGGTIIFIPTKADPSHPVILPSLPTPSTSPPPADTNAIGLKCHARARIPTPHGHVFLHLYKTNQDAKEHLAIVFDPVQMEDAAGVQAKDHIRSRSLDAVWREGETEMERLIRGAYVGRLSHAGGKASAPTAPEGDDATPAVPPPTPLVRIHSECFTGETLGSQRCDCGEQLDESLRIISLPTFAPHTSSSPPSSSSPPLVPGRGVIVYLRQEGRGIGLLSKLLAYNLQDLGHDTVEANLALGHGADERKWDVAGGILADLGFGGETGEGVRLMTNNPGKVEGLRGEGVQVVERVGMVPRAWESYPHGEMGSEGAGKEKEVGPLSLALEGQFHPEVKKEEREREAERREWMARRSGVGMIGGGETRSEELDRYLKTKVERMGHILELPKD